MPLRTRHLQTSGAATLTLLKVAHTLIWAFFVACILGMPLASWRGEHGVAAGLALLVALEGVVLALNHGRCPITGVAARYTTDRQDNFDIYLPLWLARHNKTIFGALYLAGLVFGAVRWSLGPS